MSSSDHQPPPQTTTTMATVDEEEAVKTLVRVRNRLAHRADAALPPILQQLLPRLVSRFIATLPQPPPSSASTPTSSSSGDHHQPSSPAVRLPSEAVVAETAGIFTHLYDRLQLNHSQSDSIIAHPSWCLALLTKVAASSSSASACADYDNDCNNDDIPMYTAVLPVLEIALLQCYYRDHRTTRTTAFAVTCFDHLITILHRLETRLRRTTESVYTDPFGHVQVRHLETAWARASWMVLDCVAVWLCQIIPVLDWQKDLGDDGYNHNNNYTNHKSGVAESVGTKKTKNNYDDPTTDSTTVSTAPGAGPTPVVVVESKLVVPLKFHRDTLQSLFLDVLLFRPNDRDTMTSLSRLTKYRCEFRRRGTWTTTRSTNPTNTTTTSTTGTAEPPVVPAAADILVHGSFLQTQRLVNNQIVQSGRFGRSRLTTVDTWITAECAHWQVLQYSVMRGTKVLLGTGGSTTTNDNNNVARNGIYIMIMGGLPKEEPSSNQPANNAQRPLVSELVQQMMRSPKKRLSTTDVVKITTTTASSQAAVASICSIELALYLMSRLVGDDNDHNNEEDDDDVAPHMTANRNGSTRKSTTINPHMRALPLPPAAWQRTFQFLQRCHLEWSTTATEGNDGDDNQTPFYRTFLRRIVQVARDATHHVDDKVAMETYELIGSRIPPSLCFEMKTLTSFLQSVTAAGSHQHHHHHRRQHLAKMIAKERWRCATMMLSAFRDDQVRRYRRDLDAERRMTTDAMLIHRNRERLARNDPFVFHAIQMRLEAYASIAEYTPHVNLWLDPIPSTSASLNWDVAAMSLNCAVHDTRSEVSSRLQEACTAVLECYKQQACTAPTDQTNRTQLLYMPIQQACSSSETWVRSLGCQWAFRVVEKYDPLFARVVYSCMVHDVDEAIVMASVTALSNAPYRDEPVVPVATFVNLDAVNNDIKADLRDRINAIQQFGQFDKDAAFLCLREHQFSVDIAKTFLETAAATLLPAVTNKAQAPAELLDDHPADAFCGVCFDPIDPEAMGSSLMCCHYFCTGCWHDAIDVVVSDRGLESLVGLTCLRHDCHEQVTSQALSFLSPKWARRWETALLESFVNNCDTYCFCPQSDCMSVAVQPDSTCPVTSATCTSCNTTFCPTCGEGAHSPVPCQILREYQTEANRRNAIIDEIESRIQPCPHCGQRIQKNGGCNHMTCRACGREFCWLCLSPNWSSHTCRSHLNWDAPDGDAKFMAVQQLVLNQEQSEVAESERLDNLDDFVNRLPTCEFWTDSEISILREACNDLFQARKFLKFACVSLYGLRSKDVVREFDEKRSDLQQFVERLSYIVDSVRLATDETALMTAFRAFRFCEAAIPLYTKRLEAFLAQCFFAVDDETRYR